MGTHHPRLRLRRRQHSHEALYLLRSSALRSSASHPPPPFPRSRGLSTDSHCITLLVLHMPPESSLGGAARYAPAFALFHCVVSLASRTSPGLAWLGLHSIGRRRPPPSSNQAPADLACPSHHIAPAMAPREGGTKRSLPYVPIRPAA